MNYKDVILPKADFEQAMNEAYQLGVDGNSKEWLKDLIKTWEG